MGGASIRHICVEIFIYSNHFLQEGGCTHVCKSEGWHRNMNNGSFLLYRDEESRREKSIFIVYSTRWKKKMRPRKLNLKFKSLVEWVSVCICHWSEHPFFDHQERKKKVVNTHHRSRERQTFIRKINIFRHRQDKFHFRDEINWNMRLSKAWRRLRMVFYEFSEQKLHFLFHNVRPAFWVRKKERADNL